MYCNVIMTTLWYFVKKLQLCSTMLIRSCYGAATVKLRSVITLTYTSVIGQLHVRVQECNYFLMQLRHGWMLWLPV